MFVLQIILAAVIVYLTLMATISTSLEGETDKSILSAVGFGLSAVYAIYLLFRMPDVMHITSGMAISTYLLIYLTVASIVVLRQGQKISHMDA